MKYFVLLFFFIANTAFGQTSLYDSIIAAETRPGMPGGVALIARNGKIVYEKAWGLANLELEVPMQTDMVFCIGSITKQFTAIAILRLAEQGKLSLEDELTKYIPDYAVNGRRITIEHLLTHTAAIPENRTKELPPQPGAYSPADVVSTFKDVPVSGTPGKAFAYSNHGYIILGAILEKVTGIPYKTYLENEFFRPLEMKQTYYSDNTNIWRHRASSYLFNRAGKVQNGPEGPAGSAASAGAIHSTVGDLLKWNRALVTGKLVKKETLERAWTPYRLNNGKPTDYGYAWNTGILQGSRLVEHGGNAGGFMVHDMYFPGEDLFVAVFENFRGKLPEIVATDLAAAALGKPLRFPKMQPDSATLKGYLGMYTDSSGASRFVLFNNGKLWYQREWTGGFALTLIGKDSVQFENTSNFGKFTRDGQGKVTGLEIRNIRRSGHGYQWRVPKLSLAQTLDSIARNDGLLAAMKQFHIMKEDTACYYISQFQFNQLGYHALNNDPAVAEIMFRFNVELFPRSDNAFDSYGDALQKAGKREEAIAAYKRAVELNPQNNTSQRSLAQLTKQP